LNDEPIQAIVDPRIGDDYDLDQLKRLTFVASLCVRASALWRPTMTEVIISFYDFRSLIFGINLRSTRRYLSLQSNCRL
jgi:hypothetical protein